jgi:Uma2 family endonuclease
MSAIPIQHPFHSVEEYYRLEDLAEVRSEYHDGQILAMAGGSMSHSQICINLGRELSTRLKGKPCQAFDANLRTRIESSNRNVYPDLSIVCGPVERDPRDPSNGTITNPRVVIEVISPSTERYDRTEKRDHYLKIPSLQAHVLVDQDRPRVEVLTRTQDGRWELRFATGLEVTMKLDAIGVEIPLKEIYDRVEFPPPQPPIGA